ncbi:MAG TPA: cation acetate symporter [Gammaproteobacteria bacterium]|jgi:cation/acetate symporter
MSGINFVAVATFGVFVAITLGITWWAARHTRSTHDFYAAGSRITGAQNGLAIAGDFLSAATFLGITGLTYLFGLDAVIYVLSALTGLALMTLLIAEPFRHLGRFTLSDVAAYRLRQRPIRAFTALTSLVVVLFYLVSQMVGAGALIQLLSGLPYVGAVTLIGALMMIYVTAGGMVATTWVQIIKAVLMLVGITVLSICTLQQFDFDLVRLYREASAVHRLGTAIFAPGGMLDPVSMVSLAMALVFGFIGLPHVLMRLYTVPDARAAYHSMLYATIIIGVISAFVFFIIGYGAIPLLAGAEGVRDESGRIIGGSNMVAVHLARVVAGDFFLGFISASVFATILAVVAGLTLAGASALSHDLYANVLRHGNAGEKEEIRVTRAAAVGLGIVSILLAVLFERQNIAYMASLVFAISASANFPILILAIYWRGLTTRGALAGGGLGLAIAVTLIILGPTVWVEVLGNEKPLFPWMYPALFSMPAAFLVTWIVSVTDRSAEAAEDRRRFDLQFQHLNG